MALTKLEKRVRIKNRVRKIVSGTAERPRMSVFRSNKEIYAQYIPVGKSIGANKPVNFGKSMGICIGDIGFFIALDIF